MLSILQRLNTLAIVYVLLYVAIILVLLKCHVT